jgi:predicted PurR-regulated permease PerM
MNLPPPTPKQAKLIWFALTGLAAAAMVALLAATIWGLGQALDLLSPVLWPLAIAAVVACLLSPVVDFFERRKLSRTQSILLVFVLAFAIVSAVLASVIPRVVAETRLLAERVPAYSENLQARLNQFLAQPPSFLSHFLPPPAPGPNPNPETPPQNPMLASATHWLTGSLPAFGSWLLLRVAKVISGVGALAGLALIPVYAFYFLLEQRGIASHWKNYLPLRDSTVKNELIFALEAISGYLVAFFRGQVLVALCDAVLYTAGLLMVGLNYAFLLGFAAVLLTMIPYLGAIVICLTALTLAFVQYVDWQHPALVLCVFAAVQALEGLVISPKIMGQRVGLHPLAIIVAVMVGTTLFGGLLGGLLAIPLAAALRVLMFRYLWQQVPAPAAAAPARPPAA